MESERVAILYNQFGWYLDNVQSNIKGCGGTNNIGTKVLNVFNNNMVKLNGIDKMWDSKHGNY